MLLKNRGSGPWERLTSARPPASDLSHAISFARQTAKLLCPPQCTEQLQLLGVSVDIWDFQRRDPDIPGRGVALSRFGWLGHLHPAPLLQLPKIQNAAVLGRSETSPTMYLEQRCLESISASAVALRPSFCASYTLSIVAASIALVPALTSRWKTMRFSARGPESSLSSCLAPRMHGRIFIVRGTFLCSFFFHS